jgi:hypothetical protein
VLDFRDLTFVQCSRDYSFISEREAGAIRKNGEDRRGITYSLQGKCWVFDLERYCLPDAL